MTASTSQPPSPGPGNRQTPRVPPLALVLFVVLALASMAHSAWSLLDPALFADPRPAVRSFVNALRAGAATAGDRAALSAYRETLPPRGRDALAHEVNYLLYRDGRVQRIGFDADGRVVDLAPETAPVPVEPARPGGLPTPVPPTHPDAGPPPSGGPELAPAAPRPAEANEIRKSPRKRS